MDGDLITKVVALLTAALTVYQEWRHRKAAKSVTKLSGALPVKPVRGGGKK